MDRYAWVQNYNRVAKQWNDSYEKFSKLPPGRIRETALEMLQIQGADIVFFLNLVWGALTPEDFKNLGLMQGAMPVLVDVEDPHVIAGFLLFQDNKGPKVEGYVEALQKAVSYAN